MGNLRNYKHGLSTTREYVAWQAMIARCYRSANDNYALYGGRGIKVCKRWLGPKGLLNFYADMPPHPGAGYSLDRKNSNGNYSKRNCRWALLNTEQHQNTRQNVYITFRGERRNLTNWARSIGISKNVLNYRLHVLRWSFKKAITTPLLRNRKGCQLAAALRR